MILRKGFSRRVFLQHTPTLIPVVAGFDPILRTWIIRERSSQMTLEKPPRLDGALYYDSTTLQTFGDDYGHIVHRVPRAVLRPGSINDILSIVRYANAHDLKVAVSGNHHATYGQSQAEGGIIIDARPLRKILRIDSEAATVECGVLWTELLKETLTRALTPPVTTEYQELTVGGTLSVGGIGITTPKFGAQVDNVLELEVITGDGRLISCSPIRNSGLFNAVLAGLGQCALIVRARIRLVPAPTHIVIYKLAFDDLEALLDYMSRKTLEGQLDYLQAAPAARNGGGWRFVLEAGKFFDKPGKVELAGLEKDLGQRAESPPAVLTYWDYLHSTTNRVEQGKHFPHPRIEVFIPASQVKAYVEGMLSKPADYAGAEEPARFRISPFTAHAFNRPMLKTPRTEKLFYGVGLRRSAPLNDPQALRAMLANNRSLYERARAAGGTHYPIGAIPLSQSDWENHYGIDGWRLLSSAKKEFDPRNVLTPGQAIFVTAE